MQRFKMAVVLAILHLAASAEEPLPTGALQRFELEAGVGDVGFSPDGGTLAVVGFDSTVMLFDVAQGVARRSLEGHAGRVTCLAWSPDGKLLATGSEDGGIRLWDAVNGASKGVLENVHTRGSHGNGTTSVEFFPDGKSFVSTGYDPAIRIWSTADLKEVRSLEGHFDCVVACLSPDGKLLFSASQDGKARIWDTVTGASLKALAIEPEIEAQSPHLGFPCFSPDGRTAWCGGGDGKLRGWSVPDGTPGPAWQAHGGFIGAVDVSPDGGLLVSGGMHPLGGYGVPDETWDNAIRFWDTTTRRQILELNGHTQTVNRCRFSADGEKLVTSSWDGTILIWDLKMLGLHAKSAGKDDDDALWKRLGSDVGANAWAGARTLAANPERALKLIGARLEPAKVDPDFSARLAALIRDLDDDAYQVREKAQAELIRLGPRVRESLRKTLDGEPSPEVEVRAKEILAAEAEWAPGTEDERRFVRAVTILESVGGAGAAAILEKLASGDPDSSLTALARGKLKGR